MFFLRWQRFSSCPFFISVRREPAAAAACNAPEGAHLGHGVGVGHIEKARKKRERREKERETEKEERRTTTVTTENETQSDCRHSLIETNGKKGSNFPELCGRASPLPAANTALFDTAGTSTDGFLRLSRGAEEHRCRGRKKSGDAEEHASDDDGLRPCSDPPPFASRKGEKEIESPPPFLPSVSPPFTRLRSATEWSIGKWCYRSLKQLFDVKAEKEKKNEKLRY